MIPRTPLLYCVNHFISLLPSTRFYPLKAFLLRLAGVQAHPTSQIVSSVNIWGALQVKIGPDTFLGHEVLIVGGNCTVSIGSHVDIGPRVTITTGTHEIDMVGKHSAGLGFSKDVIIADGVWIGANSTILGGVTIGRKAVIGAGSVVTKSIPEFVIAVGNPCRPTRSWTPSTGWVAFDLHK